MASSEYYIQDNENIEMQKLEAARGLYQSGDYTNSLRIYLDVLNSSYSYKLCYEVGRCYYKLDNMNDAETYFQRSI